MLTFRPATRAARSATRPLIRALGAGAACVLLGACATTLTADTPCERSDWYACGYLHGQLGASTAQARDAVRDPAARGAAGEVSSYERGRLAGLREYCTVEGGVRAGRAGRGYQDVCPPASERDFLAGFYLGALASTGAGADEP